MKKGLLCVFTLMLAAVLLTACGEKDNGKNAGDIASYDPNSFMPSAVATEVNVVGRAIENAGTQDQPDLWNGDYDPAWEEDDSDPFWDGAVDEYGNPAQIGATAIPLSPIDKPTPTPRPALAFSYAKGELAQLGLSFEYPQDWIVEEGHDFVTISDTRIRDGYRARVEVTVEAAPSSMKKADIKAKVESRLDQLHFDEGCSEWSTNAVSERQLMGKDGFYATFHGNTSNGEVKGRVHIGLCDGKLITIIYVCPASYVNDYVNVYYKVRDTMKTIK